MLKRIIVIALAFCLLLASLTAASAEEGVMHYFLDIPFEGTTVENVNDLLTEKGCTGFVKNPKVWSGAVDSFQFLGYDCRVQLDFHGKENMSRVCISTSGEIWGKGEAFRGVFQENAHKFVDLDAKLTAMYGEPEIRYFVSGIDKYDYPTDRSCFRPTDGKWSEDKLLKVFENDDQHLRAYSSWGNVILELWSNAGREYPQGYWCHVQIRYHEKDINANLDLIDYPAKLK